MSVMLKETMPIFLRNQKKQPATRSTKAFFEGGALEHWDMGGIYLGNLEKNDKFALESQQTHSFQELIIVDRLE
jgi:hypothetical protein